ncbi:hypothetical protein [Winogradskyella ouciana]|uniref:Chromosome partitioning protein ParA n=1 Tax=Winogradskyella ouciana TaxID=2608631 RepID=A0A7K1G8P6_9FLAO|nr:hypothetical protein [Winogradskyella ouciana]MTE25543.1 hypothetical protein [Winogradskyella ouciana]
MKMITKRGSKIALASIIVLVALGISYFSIKNQNIKSELEQEKIALIEELENMSNSYDELLEERNWKNDELLDAKLKIDRLVDSLETTTITLKSLLALKDRQLELHSTLKGLIRENNELKQDNGLLVQSLNIRKNELSKAHNQLVSYQDQNSQLQEEKEQLNEKVESMAFLNMVHLDARAYKERSSGKQIETDRARKTDKFEVCYTIAKNPLVKEGTKELYVQVIGPRQLVVSPKYKRFKEERFELNYSFITAFDYKNENINKCDYLDIEDSEELSKGIYTVNIYDKQSLITSYRLELK